MNNYWLKNKGEEAFAGCVSSYKDCNKAWYASDRYASDSIDTHCRVLCFHWKLNNIFKNIVGNIILEKDLKYDYYMISDLVDVCFKHIELYNPDTNRIFDYFKSIILNKLEANV